MAKKIDPNKKTDPLTIIIYSVISLFVLYLAAALGASFDRSIGENGEPDISAVTQQLNTVVYDTDYVMSKLTDTNSYTFKFTMFAAVGGALYILVVTTNKKRLHHKGQEHGSAHWAKSKEAQKLIAKSKAKTKEGKDQQGKDGADGLYIPDNNIIATEEVKISLDTRTHRKNLNVLILGGSGAGKSRFYVKPNLMQMNTSYIVTDPKGELLRSCGKMLEEHGYEVRVFNLIDMKHSHNYNPFAYVYDNNEFVKTGEKVVNPNAVIKMINVFMKNTKAEGATGGDQFWDDSAKTLFSALAFYLLESKEIDDEYINFAGMTALLKLASASETDEDAKSDLDILMEAHEIEFPDSMAASYYKDFKKAGGETAKSIIISCAVRLQFFNLPQVANLTYTDMLNLGSLGDRKTAVFVIIPASDTTFNFLAAMMYTQLFDTLYDSANFRHKGRLPVHVRCILDEFANVGVIPNFDNLIATMRSMEISANVIIQNMAQLKKMYEKSHEVIVGNCDSFLFLGSSEKETAKLISEKLGKETIDTITQNRTRSHRNPSSSENNAILGRELMTITEVNEMPESDCILFVRTFPPFYGKKFNVEKHNNYKRLEDADPKNAYEIDDIITPEMEKRPNFALIPKEENYIESAYEIDDIITPEMEKRPNFALIPKEENYTESAKDDDNAETAETEKEIETSAPELPKFEITAISDLPEDDDDFDFTEESGENIEVEQEDFESGNETEESSEFDDYDDFKGEVDTDFSDFSSDLSESDYNNDFSESEDDTGNGIDDLFDENVSDFNDTALSNEDLADMTLADTAGNMLIEADTEVLDNPDDEDILPEAGILD